MKQIICWLFKHRGSVTQDGYGGITWEASKCTRCGKVLDHGVVFSSKVSSIRRPKLKINYGKTDGEDEFGGK